VTGHPEPDRAQLAADYAPGWQVFRAEGGDLVAWLPPAMPPIVLRDRTVAGLRARLELFENVVHATGSLGQAEDAAHAFFDVR
jgi:hypothetical protein